MAFFFFVVVLIKNMLKLNNLDSGPWNTHELYCFVWCELEIKIWPFKKNKQKKH